MTNSPFLAGVVGGWCKRPGDVADDADNWPDDFFGEELAGFLGPAFDGALMGVICPDGSAATGLRGRWAISGAGDNNGTVTDIGFYCRVLEAASGWEVQPYAPETPSQQFYLTADGAPDDDRYTIRQIEAGTSWHWTMTDGELTFSPSETDADTFVLERDPDGWVRIRVAGTDSYLAFDGEGQILASETTADRFRFISDDITWNIVDRNIVYHQPIAPPTRLDFAYAATIRNCSPATLTETVGRAEGRTRTFTTSTTESVQLFSSRDIGFGVSATVGYDAGAAPGPSASVEASFNMQWTTSTTTSSSNTTTNEQSESVEVSRTRALEVPPFTGVEVFDAVRTVDNVRLPFTQVFRFTGTYEDGTPLSGSEILTQLHFNLMEGVPTGIGPDYVDVGIRGYVRVDRVFEAETDVIHLERACG